MHELASLIPVLDRPQNVVPLVQSFLTSGTPGVLVFICSPDDVDEWIAVQSQASLARVLVVPTTEAVTWPAKVNLGVSEVDADWYLCAADDITFTPGWWDTTLAARCDPRIGVIGTNDSANGTGNQAVAQGQHTCHPLIRRTYILERGIWGEPGKAVCEDYHHWYCDQELVITAKLRKAWAFCAEALLVHNHPYWGLGEWDNTYALGESRAMEDQKLWETRWRDVLLDGRFVDPE